MSPKKSGYAPVNGLKMYYEIYGNGQPLVLIHGGGSTIQSNWEKIIPFLAASREIIAVEMQAHGRTNDIDRNFTFEQDADDIATLLNHLNIPRADIFGFSNGGQTTLQLAIRHPQVVNKIIVASIGYSREGFQPWFWDMMDNATFDGMPQPLKDAFLKVNPSQENLLKMFHRDARRMQNFKGWSDELIQSIKCPAFITSGDNDIVTREHIVHMSRMIPGSRIAIFPGGHGDYLGEHSTGNTDTKLHETFARMVLSFLDGTP
ncbi:MAG TPA: alpha/beta hydrolase [Cyclobacteriaceae bacterium]|nr:alpha/beta hydrolase [Cyclobacteriaceae bacterium]